LEQALNAQFGKLPTGLEGSKWGETVNQIEANDAED